MVAAGGMQAHDPAGDGSGGEQTVHPTGHPGRAELGQPLEEQDPVSPASSSGSALDPQLFRSASDSSYMPACTTKSYSLLASAFHTLHLLTCCCSHTIRDWHTAQVWAAFTNNSCYHCRPCLLPCHLSLRHWSRLRLPT